MPGAPDGVADNNPLGKRRAIVRALGANREHVIASANQENRLVADVAFEKVPVTEACERNASGEVGTFQAMRSHDTLLSINASYLDAAAAGRFPESLTWANMPERVAPLGISRRVSTHPPGYGPASKSRNRNNGSSWRKTFAPPSRACSL